MCTRLHQRSRPPALRALRPAGPLLGRGASTGSQYLCACFEKVSEPWLAGHARVAGARDSSVRSRIHTGNTVTDVTADRERCRQRLAARAFKINHEHAGNLQCERSLGSRQAPAAALASAAPGCQDPARPGSAGMEEGACTRASADHELCLECYNGANGSDRALLTGINTDAPDRRETEEGWPAFGNASGGQSFTACVYRF